MSGNLATSGDRRVTRTRSAIVEAYGQLLQHRRQHSIRVSDIVAQANVGRSTFYEHYRSADDVFMEAVSRPLSILADAAAGRAGAERLEWLLRHFWENRQRAREMLAGRQGERVARLLAEMVEARLDGRFAMPIRLAAVQLAECAFAPVRSWLMAEAACAPEQLAAAICASSSAVLGSLRG